MMIDWDKIPKQTLLVENGEVGDCWRCCIAAVLGMPASEVPHFLDGHGAENGNCDADTQDWLNDRGFGMIYVPGGFGSLCYPRWHDRGVALPLISAGPTVRSKEIGQNHAVVTIGRKVVYDPHPSEAGLTAITEQYLIFRLLET